MPLIPDASSFGRREKLRTGAVIPQNLGREAEAKARGAQVEQGAAQQMFSVGQSVLRQAKKIQDREDSLAMAEQRSLFTQKMISFEDSLNGDTDYKTYGDRHFKEMEKAKKEGAAQIKNNTLRKTFEVNADLDMQQGLSRMAKRSWNTEKEHALAKSNNMLANYREMLLSTKDPAVGASVINDMKSMLAMNVKNGYRDADEAENLARGAAVDLQVSKISMLDPNSRIHVLEADGLDTEFIPSDTKKALLDKAKSESLNNEKRKLWVQQQAKEAMFNDASRSVEESKSLDEIDPTSWMLMDQNQRNALKAQSKAAAEGRDIPTIPERFYQLKLLASGTPEEQEKFKTMNLNDARGSLNTQDWDEVTNWQKTMRAGKKPDGLDTFLTETQIINDTLNIKHGSTEEKRSAKFRQHVAKQVIKLQDMTKKPATDQDIQKIVDKAILSEEVKSGHWFINDPVKSVYELKPGETFDIPDNDRSEIETELQARGIPVTEGEVLKWYKMFNE